MFKDRVRHSRLLRGYTQEELAELLDVSKNQISRYERGENKPTADMLVRISEVLRVSTDYLLGVSDVFDPFEGVGLTGREKSVISALRHGDLKEAIKAIVSDE